MNVKRIVGFTFEIAGYCLLTLVFNLGVAVGVLFFFFGAQMTQDEMREILRMHISERYKRQRNAARRWGVSDAYISSVLLGKKRPSRRILGEIGLREKVTIEYVFVDSHHY